MESGDFLIFIKDGCPCSEAEQPFFNRLGSRTYGRVPAAEPRCSSWLVCPHR